MQMRPWLQRVLALLLLASSLYLLAIDQLSPHHLPGLRWVAFCVLGTALMVGFLATRFRRVEVVLCAGALVCALCGVSEIFLVSGAHGGSHGAKTASR